MIKLLKRMLKMTQGDDALGSIAMWASPRVPMYYRVCDGSSLEIASNPALYSIIGLTYGGDAKTFKLPDLRPVDPKGNKISTREWVSKGCYYIICVQGIYPQFE